jgi:hypothetical protein
MKEALSSSETSVLTKPHGVTSQKTPFFTTNTISLEYMPYHSYPIPLDIPEGILCSEIKMKCL